MAIIAEVKDLEKASNFWNNIVPIKVSKGITDLAREHLDVEITEIKRDVLVNQLFSDIDVDIKRNYLIISCATNLGKQVHAYINDSVDRLVVCKDQLKFAPNEIDYNGHKIPISMFSYAMDIPKKSLTVFMKMQVVEEHIKNFKCTADMKKAVCVYLGKLSDSDKKFKNVDLLPDTTVQRCNFTSVRPFPMLLYDIGYVGGTQYCLVCGISEKSKELHETVMQDIFSSLKQKEISDYSFIKCCNECDKSIKRSWSGELDLDV